MMLNKAFAHLQILGNNIYTRKSNKHLPIQSQQQKHFKVNSKDNRTTFYCIYNKFVYIL